MSRTAEELLTESLFHLAVLEKYAQRDLSDQVVIDAISMRLSAGIEALSRLSPEDRDAVVGSDWPDMWGMRNRIAHGYLFLDTNTLISTVEDDLPPLLARIRTALATFEKGTSSSAPRTD